jgi:hypothetical protein
VRIRHLLVSSRCWGCHCWLDQQCSSGREDTAGRARSAPKAKSVVGPRQLIGFRPWHDVTVGGSILKEMTSCGLIGSLRGKIAGAKRPSLAFVGPNTLTDAGRYVGINRVGCERRNRSLCAIPVRDRRDSYLQLRTLN